MTSADSVAAVVRRIIPAPPDVVFDQWLDAESLREWMCPRPARATGVEIDPRRGGRFRIDVEELGQRFHVEGTYLVLDRPRRLQFTWSCSTWEPASDSRVTVTFDEVGDGETLMTIRHDQLPAGLLEQHQRGWELIAEQLGSAPAVGPSAERS